MGESAQSSLFESPPPAIELGLIERWASARALTPAIGVDEAGRGPLAGPVVAAAVSFPPGALPGALRTLNDSKKLSERQREALWAPIREYALAFSIAEVSAPRIDELNILQATWEAMRAATRAVTEQLGEQGLAPRCLFVDGKFPLPAYEGHQHALIKGDQRSLQIAAASVLAKVSRDRILLSWEEKYPGYGFASHKGYGTKAHLAALRALGPTPEHRRSFRPVREAIAEQGGEDHARDPTRGGLPK